MRKEDVAERRERLTETDVAVVAVVAGEALGCFGVVEGGWA